MTKRSIVFLVENPFTQRDYERLGVDTFFTRGYHVEILQVTPITKPHVHRCFGFRRICTSHHLVSDKKVLTDLLEKIKPELLICLISYGLKSFPLLRILSRTDVPICVLGYSNLFNKIKSIKNFSFYVQRITLGNVADRFFRMMSPRWFGIKPANLCLVLGGADYAPSGFVDAATKIVYAHSLDYDLLFKDSSKKICQLNDNAVFLDEYTPYHPDYVNAGVKPIKAEPYYEALNKFFDYFEKKTNLEVSIAAHPKSEYEKYGNPYEGRGVTKGKSLELVSKSRVVLAHMSTATNFAVLLKKPLIFLTTNAFNTLHYEHVKALSTALGKPIINLDNLPYHYDAVDFYGLNEEFYSNYVDAYVKKENTPNKNSWDILLDAWEDIQTLGSMADRS